MRHRFAVPAALVAAGCNMHPPDLSEPFCARTEVEAYSAGDAECVLLDDSNGLTLFKLETSESCGGPPCLRLEPGQVGYALEKIKPTAGAEWNVTRGACDQVPQCGDEPRVESE
jgi:hypothetical protein